MISDRWYQRRSVTRWPTSLRSFEPWVDDGSQQAFAHRFGFPVATLRDWEQGRRGPETSARVLLTVIDKEPDAVRRALAFA